MSVFICRGSFLQLYILYQDPDIASLPQIDVIIYDTVVIIFLSGAGDIEHSGESAPSFCRFVLFNLLWLQISY